MDRSFLGFFGLFLISRDHCLRVGKSRPAERCHVKVDNQVEGKHVSADYVNSVHVPRNVPEQEIFAKERDVAEENPGDHQDRRENSHDGSISEFLKRVELLLG